VDSKAIQYNHIGPSGGFRDHRRRIPSLWVGAIPVIRAVS
jgi:hypothetical protein